MGVESSAYLDAARNGQLAEKAEAARERLACCTLCPRRCGVDRLAGETGFCRTGRRAWVSSLSPHYGEESPLVGTGGSGTLFFTHCNLGCNFCQNYDISHLGEGEPVSDSQLADCMVALQNMGCHNINFVTPSHVVPQVLSALEIAVGKGLTVPLVYNSSGYDDTETLKLLDGVVDIYMPDFKFWDPEIARTTCSAPDYPERARDAVREMHCQVGDLRMDGNGIARRGVLLRHLVMPGGVAGTRNIMRFIAQNISADTYVNIMPQYRPCGTAHETEGLGSALSPSDYESALADARAEGIHRLDRRRRTFIIR